MSLPTIELISRVYRHTFEVLDLLTLRVDALRFLLFRLTVLLFLLLLPMFLSSLFALEWTTSVKSWSTADANALGSRVNKPIATSVSKSWKRTLCLGPMNFDG